MRRGTVQDATRLRHRMERVLEVLREADGQWVPAWRLSQPHVGGHRFGARLKELRDRGYRIEVRPAAGSTSVYEYRLVGEPLPQVRYRSLYCDACGWRGLEVQAIRSLDGFLCPQAGCHAPVRLVEDV